MFSAERLIQWNYAYDLDCGGYSWANPDAASGLAEFACVTWDAPDLNYIGLTDAIPREHRHGSCPMLAFAPNSGHWAATEWPTELPSPWEGSVYRRVADGSLLETDHECNCRGDSSDKPLPNCERCNGTGYVTSDGGKWAFYVLEEG